MGCGASSAAPAKYEVAADARSEPAKATPAPPGQVAAEAAPTGAPSSAAPAAAAAVSSGSESYETVFSCAPDAEGVAQRVSDELKKVGYRVGEGRAALSQTSSVVVCLSREYFATERCCAEFCMAVRNGITIVLVIVEGATWGLKKRPEADDVPEAVIDGADGTLRPREAFESAMAHGAAQRMLEHSRSVVPAVPEK